MRRFLTDLFSRSAYDPPPHGELGADELLIRGARWYAGRGRTPGRGDLRIRHGEIDEIGRGLRAENGALTLDASSYTVFPGLINGHDHLAFNLFPQLGNPPYGNAYEWGEEIYRPEDSPIREILNVPLWARLWWSALKNLAGGATTVVHHDELYPSLRRPSFPVRVLQPYCWAHSLGHEPDVADRYREDRPFLVHAAEGTDGRSAREIEELEDLDLLRANTVLVHGVAVRPDREQLLYARGTSLVWCPTSNQYLFDETAPVDRLAPSMSIALGTDSTLTGGSTILEELRTAERTGRLDPHRSIELVTEEAAEVFDIRDGRGHIRPGSPADLILIPRRTDLPEADLLDPNVRTPSLVLRAGEPELASPRLADRLGLGPPNVRIENEERWVGFEFDVLLECVRHHVPSEVLAAQPLPFRPIGSAA